MHAGQIEPVCVPIRLKYRARCRGAAPVVAHKRRRVLPVAPLAQHTPRADRGASQHGKWQRMAQHFEFGFDTFGDITTDPDGQPPHPRPGHPQRHRGGRPRRRARRRRLWRRRASPRRISSVSAPEIVLAAIAGRTKRINLGSAVTVLCSDDPDPGVRAVLDAQCRLERPRRGDRRPRLVHRILSAVRLRSLAIRGAVRGKDSICSPRCCGPTP